MRRLEVERNARNILRDHNLLQLPVDPLKVAHALNIRVMNAKFSEENKSGVVSKRGNDLSIYLDYDDPSWRKRFTIAHEIAHIVLHMLEGDSEYIDAEDNFRNTSPEAGQWTDEKQKEWEANVFAAALLMDGDLVKAEWSKTHELSLLAWKFQVSETAMAIRLSTLNLTEEYV